MRNPVQSVPWPLTVPPFNLENHFICWQKAQNTDSPDIAQLVEHLTVDLRSNQMVPGSIPGVRICLNGKEKGKGGGKLMACKGTRIPRAAADALNHVVVGSSSQ